MSTAWRDPARRPVLVAVGVAAVLGIAYLLAPLTGQDLSAQIHHADFARAHPLTPVDLSWFGATLPFGYSLWAPLVMAWVGVRLVGVLCSVLASAQLTVLFGRGGARRPVLGGVAAAVCQTLNLVAGRVTFSLGMICGLGALLALSSGQSRHAADASRRRAAAIVLAFLAGAASPVAALLLWVCAGALILRARFGQGALLLAASAAPVAVIAGVFGEGGAETFPGRDARDALLATAVVVLVLPLRPVVLRLGALLGIVMVLAAFLLDTPVGNNATRLSLLFAVPVVAAFVTWRPWLTGVAILLVAWPQQLASRYAITWGPAATPAYYAPLVTQIRQQGPLVGRVEVPETSAHWNTAFLARSVPLARGWLRQLDVALNGPVFFEHPPTAAAYRSWLAANSVQYVAIPDAKTTVAGGWERDVVLGGLPYLTPLWRNAHWRLYAVRDPVPVVRAPGRLTSMTATTIELTAPPDTVVTVQLRWSRWLSLRSSDPSACIDATAQDAVRLRAGAGGRYRIGSRLFGPAGHC